MVSAVSPTCHTSLPYRPSPVPYTSESSPGEGPRTEVTWVREVGVAYGTTISAPAAERPDPDPEDLTHPSIQELDTRGLFLLMKKYARFGNLARHGFLVALQRLRESRLHLELGYGSARQLLLAEFGMTRSNASIYLQVAGKLDEMSRSVAAFREGALSWSKLRELSRIVTLENEPRWLEFALDGDHGADHLAREVTMALRENRDLPRARDYGLPNITTRVTLELTLEEKERFSTAMRHVSAAMGETSGGRQHDLGSVLLFLSHKILEEGFGVSVDAGSSTVATVPTGSQTRARDHSFKILYHQCPDCRSGKVHTVDGTVVVEPAVVDRIRDVAEVVTIEPGEELELTPLPVGERDRPNDARLARQVLCRDGLCCASPHCGRTVNLHSHHLQWRSQGGRTALFNELTLCDRCHALVHAGLLDIGGDPTGELQWRPRVRDWVPEVCSQDFVDLEIPGVHTVAPAGLATLNLDIDLVERALIHIGHSKKDAEKLVAAGLVLLREQQPSAPVEFDEEDLIAFALQKKPAPFDRIRRHGRQR